METREELIAKTAKSVFWEQQQKREKRDSVKESPKDMTLSGFVGYKRHRHPLAGTICEIHDCFFAERHGL
jgi:hypothetical protein